MLCVERKRTERSGRRFVLMLLESGALLKTGGEQQTTRTILSTLSYSTRETDIKGWYKDGCVIGIIVTEIGVSEGIIVASALFTRITNALSGSLSMEEINKIRVSFHVFPEEAPRDPGASPLYPDLALKADLQRASRLVKRSMDIAGSLLAMTILLPLFMIISAIVKLTSKGPIFFRQERVRQYGNRFTFLKFRSMYFASDHTLHREYVRRLISGGTGREQPAGNQPILYKLINDPRITPVGRLLRRTSLDELPQFVNVLRGQMSLVGPRPPIPYEFEAYDLWHKQRLLAVKPGITGLWQVAGRSRVNFDEMVRLDIQYARSWSLWLDIKILLKTPRAVLSGEGAY